jgi:hypothetical protein
MPTILQTLYLMDLLVAPVKSSWSLMPGFQPLETATSFQVQFLLNTLNAFVSLTTLFFQNRKWGHKGLYITTQRPRTKSAAITSSSEK